MDREISAIPGVVERTAQPTAKAEASIAINTLCLHMLSSNKAHAFTVGLVSANKPGNSM
jgi:hypothetical protein